MTFLDLGSALRDARVAQGLSIEDIADKLKLTARLVRTLEDGDVKGLPHAVYTRGFIRGYASIVKVNLEEYQQAIDTQYPIDVPEEYEEKITLVPSVHRRSKNKRLLILTSLVLCGIAFGAYWKYSQPTEIVVPVSIGTNATTGASQGAEANSSVPTTTMPKQPSADKAQNSQQGQSGTVNSASSNDEASAPLTIEQRIAKDMAQGQSIKPQSSEQDASSGAPEAQASSTASLVGHVDESDANSAPDTQANTVVSAKTEDTSTAPKTNPEKAPAVKQAAHHVVITAHEDCWMRLVADGGKAKQMVLKKGETIAQDFKGNLEMRFGNAGGVSLTCDGKNMPAPGKRGQAVTVTYPLQD
ncbi:MAG: DUF4115 domain-containing protein [Pseudomonadota bacterium]